MPGIIKRRDDLDVVQLGPRPTGSGDAVALAFDHAYAFYASILILSIFLSSGRRSFDLVVLGDELNQGDIDRLAKLAEAFHRSISVAQVRAAAHPLFHSSGRWSRSTHYRALAPDIIDAARIAYLDSDCLAFTDLAELFAEYRPDGLVGAVSERDGTRREARYSPLGIGGDLYVNAGVMLIDAETWRAEGLTCRYVQCLQAFEGRLACPDQDVLNIVLKGRKYPIEAKWNTMIHELGGRGLKQKLRREGIWHFTITQPWKRWTDPWLRDVYLSFAEVIGPAPESYWKEPETVKEWILTAQNAELDGERAKVDAIYKHLVRAFVGDDKSLLKKRIGPL